MDKTAEMKENRQRTEELGELLKATKFEIDEGFLLLTISAKDEVNIYGSGEKVLPIANGIADALTGGTVQKIIWKGERP